jgi:hypothetical protein
MEHYAGIDVSLESASVCVVDGKGRIVREAKVPSEPEALGTWFTGLGLELAWVGLEAGPLSQWLHAGLQQFGLPVELLETRHVRDAFKAMPVKTDRKDARGIAQLMRLGWFRPVHCKSLPAQEVRASQAPSSIPPSAGSRTSIFATIIASWNRIPQGLGQARCGSATARSSAKDAPHTSSQTGHLISGQIGSTRSARAVMLQVCDYAAALWPCRHKSGHK